MTRTPDACRAAGRPPGAPGALWERERWGIYEKALPHGLSWPELLHAAATAGYQFLEVSIDESDERLSRLSWPVGKRRALHAALASAPVPIGTMCLSAHRKHSLGSLSPEVRERGLTIMRRAIDFATEFGLRIVQVAGYDVFYEESTERTRALYRENLCRSAEWAREAGVMLGLENVDCPVAESISKALTFVREAQTPWFQLYPDVANLAAMGQDVPSQLREGGHHLVALHMKDGRLREIRRVPFGDGIVSFDAVFRTLHEIEYRGPMVVEMWNDGAKDPIAAAAKALRWLQDARDAAQPTQQSGESHDRSGQAR
jgi:L-ribulose-5-phosphate 3-epimerase